MRPTFLLAALPALCGCESIDSGAEAMMRVQGAQFFPGEMPADTAGPEVAQLLLPTNFFLPGQLGKPLGGALDPKSTAAAIALRGDRGYWIVPAGLPDVQAPEYPTFEARLDFSPEIEPGTHDLVVRAVDERERFGPEATAPLSSNEPLPAAALLIELWWDTEADLDLHVVDPLGNEIFKRDPSTLEPPEPGQVPTQEDLDRAGVLDFDSNAQCVIDGRRLERVLWKADPPSGSYVARVDTFSLCGEPAAHWAVRVLVAGAPAPIAIAAGTSTEWDTQQPHDRGAGVVAVEFTLP